MFKIQATRESGPYRPSYRHLNTTEDLGFEVKVVKGRPSLDDDGGISYALYLTTAQPVARRDMIDALAVFERDCRCEHDCCGHYFGGAHYRTLRSNNRGTRWTVRVAYARNI